MRNWFNQSDCLLRNLNTCTLQISGKRTWTTNWALPETNRSENCTSIAWNTSSPPLKGTVQMRHMEKVNSLKCVFGRIRSLGCAALSLCYVACGYNDAYQCDGLYPWDSAAGVLIVREAGGYVCDTSGEKRSLLFTAFLTSLVSLLGWNSFKLLSRTYLTWYFVHIHIFNGNILLSRFWANEVKNFFKQSYLNVNYHQNNSYLVLKHYYKLMCQEI